MNKRIVYISFFLISSITNAQTALYNSGNLRIHENGNIGFHTDLINDTTFDQNLGLVGFYGDNTIDVSGAFAPTFYDVEINNASGVSLSTGIYVENNTNFIIGDFMTSRILGGIYYRFLQNAFYTGEGNTSKIDGYAVVNNKRNISFPVGDRLQLRALTLNSEATNISASCAYFREDPDSPTTIEDQFDRDSRPRSLGEISATEFWKLEGSVPSTVTFSWNTESNLVDIAIALEEITIVGWSKTLNRWTEIGVTARSGDINEGFAISRTFIPNDYDALTFAGLPAPTDTFAVNNPTLGNYYISPNADGLNDFLVFEDLGASSDNFLQIYDRFGLKVFEATDYVDEFTGTANVDNPVIKCSAGLPNGIYFYVIALRDLGLNYQGFLYLSR